MKKKQEAAAEMKSAEAQKYAKEQEAAGIAAVGKAEAEAIRAKALAEAEGIDKKAEAMKKYGEAAVVEMIMAALPEIAKNVAEPLSKVDKITMYGEGNSAKLLADIVNGTTQVTEGISAGMGIDLKSLLAGALGGKLAAKEAAPVVVVPAGCAVQKGTGRAAVRLCRGRRFAGRINISIFTQKRAAARPFLVCRRTPFFDRKDRVHSRLCAAYAARSGKINRDAVEDPV